MPSSRNFSWFIQKWIISKYAQLLVEKTGYCTLTQWQELFQALVDELTKSALNKLMCCLFQPYLEAPFSKRKYVKWIRWLWTTLGIVDSFYSIGFPTISLSCLETFPLTCLLGAYAATLYSQAVHWKTFESKTNNNFSQNRANKISGIQEGMDKFSETIVDWIFASCYSL